MADSTDPSPSRSAGLGRILSRRQGNADAAATGSSTRQPPASNGMALLQRLFAGAHEPEALLHAFAQGMCTLPGELGDMGQRLHSAQAERDWERYGRLLRQLIDKYIRTVELDTPAAGDGDAARLRDLLRDTLEVVLANLLLQAPELRQQADRVGLELRNWQPGQSLAPVEQPLRELCHQAGVRNDGLQEQHNLLLNLFDLLLENITELLDGDSWLQGQIKTVRQLLSGPLDHTSLEQTRSELREVIYRQGLLKEGIDASKTAMKELMVDFIQQMDDIASDAGDYHDRLAGYAVSVRQVRNIADLNQLLQDVLQDTARAQGQALRARDHLANARAEARAAEQRVLQLERELEDAGNQLRSDPLTGALNRRGLDEVLGAALQAGTGPLSVALLDLDHFGTLNTAHGHAGGDQALRHMVAVLQQRLRGGDHLARFGGDEFVLVLPGCGRGEALENVRQLQASLVQRPFLYEGERVQVRFSAGVATALPGETADALLQRADRALYAAKQAGRNQVIHAK